MLDIVMDLTPVTFGSVIEDVDDEEKSTFLDIITRYRGGADIVHPDKKEAIKVFVTRSLEDTHATCEEIRRVL